MNNKHHPDLKPAGSPFLRRLRRHHRFPLAALMIPCLMCWSVPASGATLTWVGGTGLWDTTATNWNPGPVAWVNGTDLAQFSTGSGLVTLGVPISAGGLIFGSNGYTLTGSTLTLAGPPGSVAPVITVDRGVVAIVDSLLAGTAGFVKTGPGSLRLTNAGNTYTGSTTILDGSLVVTNPAQLGLSGTAITVGGNLAGNASLGFPGGTLVLQGGPVSGAGMNFTRDIGLQGRSGNLSGPTLLSIGNTTISGNISTSSSVETRLVASGGTTTISGVFNLGQANVGQIMYGPGNWNITGQVTGGSDGQIHLVKANTGINTTLILGNNNNTFLGATRVDGGTVRVSHGGQLGVSTSNNISPITFNTGTFEIRTDAPSSFATKNISYSSNSGTIFVDHAIGSALVGQTVTFNNLRQENNRTFTFTGRNGTNISIATLSNSMSGTSSETFAWTGNGTMTVNGTTMRAEADGTARGLTITATGELVINPNITASGAAHTVSKNGSGVLTLNGTAGTWTGATGIAAGTLEISNVGAVGGTSQINIGNATTTAGTLTYTGAAATLSKNILLNTTTAPVYFNASGSGALTYNGTFVNSVNGAHTLVLGGTSTADNTIASVIPVNTTPAAVTSLQKIGTGTWVLAPTANNTFTGGTTLSQGTLKLQELAGDFDILPNAGAITIGVNAFNQAAGGTLNYIGATGGASAETVGALTLTAGQGNITATPGGGTATLTLASAPANTAGIGSGVNVANTGTVNITGTAGFINAGITFGGNHFAYSGAGTTLRAPVYDTDAGFVTAGASLLAGHNNVTGPTNTGALTISSLRIDGAQTVTQTDVLTIQTGAGARGGILQTNGAGTITGTGVTSGGAGDLAVRVDTGSSLTLSAPVTATTTGGVTKSGNGTLILNAVNAQTGNFNINEGTVQLLGATTTIGANNTNVNLRQNATLDLNGVNINATTASINSLNGAGTITNNGVAAQIDLGSSGGAGYFTGIIQNGSGVLSVNKSGAGVLSLTGLNTFTGPLTITGGTIAATTLANIGQPSSIGAGDATSVATNQGSIVFVSGTSGTIQYTGSNATIFRETGTPSVSIDRLFTITGGATGTIDSSGQFGNNVQAAGAQNNAALVFNNINPIAYAGTGTAVLGLAGNSTGDNTFMPQLADVNIAVTKTGTGLWILAPTANNTYGGATTLTAGTLRAQDGVGLSANSNLVMNGGTLESSGTFSRGIGTGPGQIQWTGTAALGFAGGTGPLTVNLDGGSTLVWGSTANFNSTGALVLGSATALDVVTIANPIDLNAGTRTITVTENALTAMGTDYGVISGVISGTGASNLTKNGAGLLYLTGANTYNGSTTIGDGQLAVTSIGSGGASSNLGNATGALNIGATTVAGYLLYYGEGETTTRTINLNGTTGGATIDASGSGPILLNTVTNAIGGAKTLTLRGFNLDNNTISSNLNDNGGILSVTKSDPGTWVLTGTNGFTGTLTVNGGLLGFSSAAALGAPGTGTIALSNGGLFNSSSAPVSVARALSIGANATNVFSGNQSMTFTGAVTLPDGGNDEVWAVSNMLPTGSTLTFAPTSGNLTNSEATATDTRILRVEGIGSTIINATYTNQGTVTDVTADGAGILVQTGNSGGLTLGGANPNTFTRGTTLTQGNLILAKNSALGTFTATNNTFAFNGGVLSTTVGGGTTIGNPTILNGNLATVNSAQPITFSGTFTNNGANRRFVNNGAGLVTLSGGVALSNDATSRILTLDGTGNITISSIIANGSTSTAGAIVKDGTGTATLTSANTYAGATTVNNGVLLLSGAGTSVSSAHTVNQGGVLTLDNATTNNNDRLGNALAVTVNGGTLNVVTNAANTTETLGALTLGSGASVINMSGGGAANTLTFASAAFGAGSTMHVSITGLGTTNKILFTAAPALSPVTTGILPRVIVGASPEFGTYAAGTGITAFTGYNTAADINTAAATNTFKVNAGTTTSSLAANLTLNALAIDGTGLTTGGAPGTVLTLTSGGLLSKGGSNTLSVPTLLLGGEGLFHVESATTLAVSSNIKGISGVTKALDGALALNTAQSYLGTTTINGGSILLGGGNNTLFGNQPLQVNKGGTLDLNGTTQHVGSLSSVAAAPGHGGIITTSGGASSLVANITAASTFAGQITGNVSFDREGAAALTLTSNSTYTGSTVFGGGTTTLRDSGALSGTSAIAINYSTLVLDNNAGLQTAMTNRVNDAAPVTLRGGSITFTGRVMDNSTELMGAVTSAKGANTVTVNTGNSGAYFAAELTLESLSRAPSTTMNFVGGTNTLGTAGNNPRILFQNAPPSLPNGTLGAWAIANSNEFAAYSSGLGVGAVGQGGFRAYDTTFATGNVTNVEANIAAVTTTLSGNTTTSMLRLGGAFANDIAFTNATDVLNLEDGGLLRSNNNNPSAIGTAALRGHLTAGDTETSGSRELVLYNAQNTVTVNSIIENNGFGNSVVLVKSGAGTTLLTAANTYSGGTHVLQGTLNTTSLAALGSGAVTLNGGTLGLLWDGTAATNGAVTETLTVPTVINLEGSAGLTIGRVGTTFAPLNPLAVNKTVELTGLNIVSPLPGNTTLTVNNNNGFGLLLSPALALPASGGALNFSVSTASISTVVQGLTLSGIVSGGQTGNGVITLMKSGAGAMVLANAGNTFGGGGSLIDITGGYLSVGADAHLGDAGNIVRLSTGSLTQGLRATDTFATSRQIMLNGASSGIEVTEGETLTLNSTFTFSTATAGLGKNDLGTLVLTQGQTVATGATADWNGVLTINQGAVRVTHSAALGTTTGNTVLAGVVGSAIELSGGVTIADALAINPGGNNTNRGILGQGALRSVSGTNTWSGAITLITGGTDNQNRSATIKADASSTLNLTGGLVAGTGTGGTGRDSWFGVGGEGTVNITTTTLTQAGAVSANLFSLVKIGSGTLNLQVANAMGGQQVIVKEGTLSVNGAGSIGVPTVGAPGTVFINPTATLEINNTVTPTTNRFSSRNLDLRGGNLTVLGNSTATTSETIGAVTLNYGAGVITLTADPAQALTVLQGNVTRNAGSSLLVRGSGLGGIAGPGVANLGGNTGANAYAFVGQLGASDTFNKSVLPYALGDTSDTGLGAGFLTSASIQGAVNTSTNTLRVLNSATEQVTTLGAPVLANTAENISLTSVVDFTASVFAGNPFLANTLQLNSGGGLQMVGMRTFTVDSGGILAFTGNTGITNSAALLSTTANRELIVHALGNLTIASNIVGSTGGLTKTGAGTLELTSGFNTYTGATYINNGVLKLSGGDQTLFQNQNLTLMGGSLDLNGSIQNVNILRADVQALGRGDLHAPIGGSVINTSGTEATLAVTTGTTFSGTIGNGNLADSDIAVARSTAAGATSDWNLYGNNTYTGASLFNGGRVQLLDTGRLSGTTSIEISNATLLLGASNTSANLMEVVDRVNDLAAITLRGGMFQGRGYAAETYSETLGALILAGAGNYIDIAEPGTNLNSMDYTFASLSQAAGSRATLRVFNVDGGLGSAARTFFTSGPMLTNNIIGGWAVFEREFASYIPQVGLGGLSSNGFAGYSTALINDAAATDNIRIVTPAGGSTTTLTGNRTMNSLNMQATGTATANSILDLGGNTLTLSSGGLILSPNTATFAYTVQNGSITAGTAGVGGDLYLHGLTHFNGDADNTGNRDITVSSSIIDNAGGPVSLVIAGSMGRGTEFNTNDIFITGTNSHTGGTWVNSGRITLNNPAANGTSITAIPGNLILAGGYGANNGDFAQRNTAVTLAAPSQIANTATVTVRGGATLDLAGFNQTLAGLNFENTGGTNPTVTTGTGILTLAGNISATGNNVGSVSTIATTGLGEVSLGGATRTITVAPVEWQGRNLNPLHPNLNISGVVTGTGAEGIIKAGTGILQLSGQSTFSGGVALNTGGLMVGGSSTPSAPGSTVVSGPLGTGTLNIAANTFLTSSAAANAVANDYVIGGNFSFTGINALALNGTTTLPSGATTITVQDPTSTPSASALILGGVISGTDNTSSIIKAGLGTLALNNNNTFLGGVTLNAGNLVLGGAPLSNNASPSPTVLVNSADAVLSLMNNGAGSGGVISYSSVIDIANTLPSANLHVGNFSANTSNVIEVGNLNLTNTTTLNVSSANLYALRLLNLNTTGGPANINVAAGTTVLVFNYGLNQPVNVGPGQLLFPDQPLINKLDNVAVGGSPIALSGTYPLVPKFNALGTTAPTGFNPGGLSASHYSFGSALNTISVGTSGVAPTAQRASTALLGNATYSDRPLGVSPANNVNSSSVYSGLLEITTGGTYTFKTAVDDQSLLIIDGITVSGVNAAGGGTGFGDNSTTSAGTGSITLAAGFHTITYKNTNSASGGGFHLLYSGADTAGNGLTGGFQAISPTKLYFNNSPATLANGYQLAAGLTNDYTVGFGTIATIDTFGTQFNLTLNSLDLGPLSTLNIVNGAGSLGTNFVGVSGMTTISGGGAIINTGGTATSGAGILNLIGAVSDSGNGVSKFGAGALILGASNTATFTGAFDVKAGTVQLTHAQALSAGANTIGSEIVVRANSTTATGSNIVTVSSSAGLSVGQIVNGAGIVPGSYITAIDTPTPNTITLSIPATATATNAQLNIGGASLDINGLTDVEGNITIAGQGQNVMIANAAAPAASAFTGALWNSSLTPASLKSTSALTIGSPNTVIGGYGDITLNGVITATALNNIIFTGAGTNMMTVDNSTTLLSAITATSGTILKVGHASGLGDTLAGTTINSGAILDLNGITIAENITLNGAGRTNFGAPVNSLGSLINTSNTAASITGTLTLGAAASVGSNRINATSGVATAGDITLDGVVSGAFLLTKVGSNSLTLTKANTQNGLTINQGTVTVNGVAGAAGSGGNLTVNGSTISGLTFGSRLVFDNTTDAFSSRAGGAAANRSITLVGGELSILGNATTAVNEAIGTGALNINNAFNLITLTNAGANVQISTTGTGTIARSGNGTALIRGTSLGTVAGTATTNIILGTAPTATGQAGANATTNRAILPYIIADPLVAGNGTGAAAGFAVYDTTANVGLRALAAAEAVSAFTVDQNIWTSSPINAGAAVANLTTSRVNSLTFEAGGSLAIDAMRNVTVQSGGILAKSNASITGAGYLNADANANLVFHTMGAGTTLTVDVPVGGIVGPSIGGLAKSGEGTLVLNAQNSYTGETRVNAGILQIGTAAPATNALMYRWSTAPAINATASAIPADILVIQPGATLDLNGHNQSTGRLATSLTLPGAGGILTSATAASYHNLVGANSDFSGQITGSITYARSGGFTQAFTNDNTFTGSTSLYGGVTTLVDQGRFSGTSGLTINRSSLRWDDSGVQGISNRLASTIDITFNGGGFEYRSRSGTDGSITLDQLTFQSGASYLVANVGNGGVGSATINYGGLIRTAGTGATATLAASNGAVGDNPFFKAASAPTLTAGILSPWLTVFSSINPSSGTAGGAFATYDPVVGIRPISAYYETNSFATSTATSNLRFGDVNPVVPDGGATVNTLTWNGLTAARTLNFQNAADTLTLTAGGLITGNENFAKNIGTALLRGRLTTGASELFLYNTANTLTVNSEVFGGFDLVLGSMSQTANNPTISLTNANTYTGNTFVNGMILTLNNATGSGNAIPGNITVAGGTQAGGDSAAIGNAAVRLLTNNQIADSATVTVRGGSQLDLNGFSDTVDALVLVNDGGSNGNQGALVQTGAGTLTVTSGNITAAVQNSISTIPTIAGNLVLGNAATVNVGLVSGTEVTVNGTTNSQVGLALNANIKGAATLDKTGAGVLQLGGVSDSLTAINVTAGTVVLGAASNYKNSTLTLSTGTILDTRGANNLAIGTISGSGIIKNFSLTANSTLVTGNSANGIFSGTMGSDYTTAAQAPWLSVTKIGTGTWTLTGDNENNLLGTLTISNGGVTVEGPGGTSGFITTILAEGGVLTLNNATDALDDRLGDPASIGSATPNRELSMRGGVLNYIGGTTAISESLNNVTLLEGASRWNLTSSGSQTLINMVTLANSSTTNRGSLVLNAGASILGTAAPGAGNVNVIATTAPTLVGGIRPDIIGIDSTGTGFVTHDTNGFRLLTTAETQALGTAAGGTGAVLPAVVTDTSTNVELSSTSGLVVGQTVTGAGIPAGTTILNIVDANNITLSQPATVTSDTRLTFGVTDTANSAIVASSPLMQPDTVNSLTLGSGGGVVGAGGGILTSPAGQAWSLAGTPNVLTVTSGGVLANTGNTGITGVGITAGGSLLQIHAQADLALNAAVLGTGGVTKDGNGILTIGAKSYNTGAFFQNEGTTRLAAGANALLVVPNATVAVVADLVVNGGTFDLNGNSQAVRQLTNTSPGVVGSVVNTGGTAATLFTAQSAATTFSGTLGGTGGNNFNFDKGGNFNLTLQQPATYTGTTTVRGGTLILTDNAAITGGGAVSVNYGTLSFVNSGLAHVTARTGTSALTLNGGGLSITPRLEGEASVTTGALSLASGVNTVTFAAQTGIGGSFNLSGTTLARSAGATLNIPAVGTGQLGRGTEAVQGQSPQWTLSTAPTLSSNLVGGWAVYNGADFLTYRATASASGAIGFGVLGDTAAGFADYTTIDTDGGNLAADSTTRNGKYSGNFNYNVNGSIAHNSVVHSAAANGNNLTYTGFADTLTLTSGGFLRTGNFTGAIGQALDYGRITSSAAELFLFNNQSALTINSRITGTARTVFSSGTGGSTFALVNGTSRSTVGANVTNGSATVVPASFASLYVGQFVSGPGIPASTTIAAINGTTDITLSVPATATGTIAGGNFLTFGTTAGTLTQNTTTVSGNAAVTLQAANANLYVGMPVFGTGIPAGTVINSINGTAVVLSQNATANGTNVSLTYGTAGNSYSGGTTVNNGTTLQLTPAGTNQTVIPAGGLVINGGAVNFGASTTNFGLIAAANAVTINGGGSLTFPAYTGGVAYTNTLASLTFNDNGGTTTPTVALGTPGAANTTHKLILTGATPISSTNDNHNTTPTISGNFTSATRFSSIEFSNAAPTITVAGLAPQGLIISAPITQNAGMTGVLTKNGAGTLILTSGASTFTTGFTQGGTGAVMLGASSTGTGVSTGVTSGPLGTGLVTLGNNTSVLSDGTARTLANNVTVNGNITFGGTAPGHSLTLNGMVNLGGAARTITVTSPQVAATLNGIITGTAGGLVKAGDGVLLLNPQSAGALSTAGAATTTTAGSTTLSVTALPAAVVVGMAVHGAGIAPGTTVTAIAGNDVTLSQAATATTSSANVAFGTTQSYVPTAGAAAGTTLTVSPAQAATLAIGSSVTGVGIAGGTTVAAVDTGTGVVTLSAALTSAANGQNITFAGATAVPSANTYVGGTTINGGLLRMGNSNALGAPAALAVNVSGTLDLNGSSLTVAQLSSTSATTGGLITNSASTGTTTLTVGNATNTSFGGAITNNVGSTLNVVKQGSSTLTLGGPNSYSGSTTITEGNITSAASNVLPDTTLVTLAPSTGTSTLSLASFNDTIAALTFAGASGTTSTVTTGTGTLTVFDAITYDATNNPNGATISGFLNLGGGQKSITVGDSSAATADLTISATVTDFLPAGTDGITKSGAGRLLLTSGFALNSYSGSTVINGGTLAVVNLNNGGIGSDIGDSSSAASNLVINNNATFEYAGTGATTNRELTVGAGGATLDSSGTGPVSFTSTAALTLSGTDTARALTLAGSNTAVNTFALQVADNGTGATSLAKNGAGTWSLTANNTNTGTVTVNDGTLLANNTPTLAAHSATGAGPVTIGATATLGGTGSIATAAGNSITINGTLAPGTPGLSAGSDLALTVSGTGNITLANTTIIDLFANTVGSNPLTSNDRVVFGAADWSNIVFGGSSALNVTTTVDTSTWTTGDSWQIFDWSGILAGTAPITGFANITLPTLSGALVWDTSALYTSGSIIIGVPEPSRVLLLLLGLLGLLARRRRK